MACTCCLTFICERSSTSAPSARSASYRQPRSGRSSGNFQTPSVIRSTIRARRSASSRRTCASTNPSGSSWRRRQLSNRFWKVRENPIACDRVTCEDKRIPAARRTLAGVVYQAPRGVRSCRNGNRWKTKQHDRDNAIGLFHTSVSVRKIELTSV